MSAIRNSCVARGSWAASSSVAAAYTVPAGYVFLFKSLALNSPAADTPFAIWLGAGDTGAQVLYQTMSLVLNTPQLLQPWIALNGGDSLQFNAANYQVDYWVSGALLPFAPGF